MAGDWPAKKNATFELQFPIYDADGDLVSAAAALDTEVSKDGGTFADATNEASEIATSSGCYKISLTATEMDADRVMTITKTSTGGAKTAVNMMYTVVRQMLDLAFPATSGRSFVVETDGMVHGDVKEWLGVAPLTLVSQRVNVSVGAMAADVVTAAAIATDAIGAAEIASGAADKIADALLKRDIDQVEATAPKHSMTTALLKAVSRVRDNAGSLETFRTDGTTLQLAQAVTVDAGLDPIDELGVGT